MKHPLAICASAEACSCPPLLHELTPTNLDFPPPLPSTLCPKIWVQYTNWKPADYAMLRFEVAQIHYASGIPIPKDEEPGTPPP